MHALKQICNQAGQRPVNWRWALTKTYHPRIVRLKHATAETLAEAPGAGETFERWDLVEEVVGVSVLFERVEGVAVRRRDTKKVADPFTYCGIIRHVIAREVQSIRTPAQCGHDWRQASGLI